MTVSGSGANEGGEKRYVSTVEWEQRSHSLRLELGGEFWKRMQLWNILVDRYRGRCLTNIR